MSTTIPDLVSTEWLAARLDARGLVILDASHHLPATGRDAQGEFAAGHIPGARFLGLASLTDEGSSVPYALPRPDQLAARLALLGVAPGSGIVLYDDSAIRTSARAWFMLTMFGAQARHLSDMGDIDENHFVLLGGQDGWINSTTFADQVGPFLGGDLIHVPLRPSSISAAFQLRTQLLPDR
jgi:3-mercaptopyruvate sulfurtransferase SseA